MLCSAVDSSRSVWTDCPPSWQRGSQPYCCRQRGSSTYTASSQMSLEKQHCSSVLTHYDATTPAEQLDCSSSVRTRFTTVTWGLTEGSHCLSICMLTSLLFHRLIHLIFENPVLSKQWLIVARNTEKPSSAEWLSELHFLLKSTPALARGRPCDSWC